MSVYDFFYLTTIDKQVIQFLLISFVGTGVSAKGNIDSVKKNNNSKRMMTGVIFLPGKMTPSIKKKKILEKKRTRWSFFRTIYLKDTDTHPNISISSAARVGETRLARRYLMVIRIYEKGSKKCKLKRGY